MVSFAARRGIDQMLARASIVLALSMAVVPCAAGAEGVFEPIAKDDQQRRIIERIDETQSRDGPFSSELIEPFTELLDLSRKSGDPELAAAARERALQLVRVN